MKVREGESSRQRPGKEMSNLKGVVHKVDLLLRDEHPVEQQQQHHSGVPEQAQRELCKDKCLNPRNSSR